MVWLVMRLSLRLVHRLKSGIRGIGAPGIGQLGPLSCFCGDQLAEAHSAAALQAPGSVGMRGGGGQMHQPQAKVSMELPSGRQRAPHAGVAAAQQHKSMAGSISRFDTRNIATMQPSPPEPCELFLFLKRTYSVYRNRARSATLRPQISPIVHCADPITRLDWHFLGRGAQCSAGYAWAPLDRENQSEQVLGPARNAQR